jgi:hypothetical protein
MHERLAYVGDPSLLKLYHPTKAVGDTVRRGNALSTGPQLGFAFRMIVYYYLGSSITV